MAKIEHIRRGVDLKARRQVTLDLPEFLLRAFECRVAEANEDVTEEERLTLDNVVEVGLAASLSLAEIAHLERAVPGIGAAVSQWLSEIR
jgi:hypothetical protein